MHKTIIVAAAAASLLALAACNKERGTSGNAATPTAPTEHASALAGAAAINGTWEADLTTLRMPATDRYLLKDGKFYCITCVPPLTLAADGAFHPVAGRPYADSMAIKAVDDRTVTRTGKKGGRVTGEIKWTVSPDGNKLTYEFVDSSAPNAAPVKGKYRAIRVAPAPAGAHAISGTWNIDTLESLSKEGLTVTYKLDGDTLHMSSPAGQSYDAKIGGADVPIKGDIAGTTVSVKKIGDNSYEEINKRGGKVVGVTTFTVAPDGKMQVKIEDKERKQTINYTAAKV
jgi:hypothetical protein